jgi:hypothetical protein
MNMTMMNRLQHFIHFYHLFEFSRYMATIEFTEYRDDRCIQSHHTHCSYTIFSKQNNFCFEMKDRTNRTSWIRTLGTKRSELLCRCLSARSPRWLVFNWKLSDENSVQNLFFQNFYTTMFFRSLGLSWIVHTILP